MDTDAAIHELRQSSEWRGLIDDAYLGSDLFLSGERFRFSAEFAAVLELLGPDISNGTVLDLGAGNGIGTLALRWAGAKVVAVEPSPSTELGAGAIRRLVAGSHVLIVRAIGERLPMRDSCLDAVYVRAVLHHAADLSTLISEVCRVLKPGGRFLATREHVVSNERQRLAFLRSHPVHQLAGGEDAHPLAIYVDAIEASGLVIKHILGPTSSVINAYPHAKSAAELKSLSRLLLERKLGKLGRLISSSSLARRLVVEHLEHMPGRLYTFLAMKPVPELSTESLVPQRSDTPLKSPAS